MEGAGRQEGDGGGGGIRKAYLWLYDYIEGSWGGLCADDGWTERSREMEE